MSTDRSSHRKIRVWDRPMKASLEEWAVGLGGVMEPSGLALQGPHNPGEFAARLYISEALHPPVSSLRRLKQAEPYSLNWFENIETLRHRRQGRWIPKLLEFTKHAGETILCLGHGLGTDWLQYARNGAAVIVCSPSQSQLALVRRNFELRGMDARFWHASTSAIPVESASIDVACVSGLLEISPEPAAVVDQLYRVLKPGGKVLAVTRACFDVEYWRSFVFFWNRWLPGSKLEQTDALRFSGRGLKKLFDRFVEHRTHKRHLRRAEVPHVWRWLPLPMLERFLGRMLVMKAFKPLSAALPADSAAA